MESDWPPWPCTYGRHPHDINGDKIHPDQKPRAPEIFRLQATGGLQFRVSEFGFVRITISDGADASFRLSDLPFLAAYILDLYKRATTGTDGLVPLSTRHLWLIAKQGEK